MPVYTKPKPFCQYFLLVILLFLNTPIQAEIYHWQDPAGEVTFSNSPPPNDQQSTTVPNEHLNVIPHSMEEKTFNATDNTHPTTPHPPSLPSLAKTLNEASKTATINITSPENHSHIHDFYPLIPISTAPLLSAQAEVHIMVNDKTSEAIYQNNTWNIPRPEPGENQIALYGKTTTGNAFTSNTITIYVHNSHAK